MARRYGNFWYWCAEFTDANGMITEAGNESTNAALVVWLQKNLDRLPKGEGKIIRKRMRMV